MIADEANAIGTAYLRLDLLPAEAQPQLREDFRRYVRSRFSVYRAIPDAEAVRAELSKSGVIQNVIWTQAVAAVRCAGSPAIMTLVLSSVNEMINVTTTRTIALQAHPPRLIILLLGVTVLASALLVGHSLSAAGRASLIHLIVFVCVVTSAVYVILDFEYPRIGLIREDHVDAVLNEMLEKMK
jgi:hypothetical protein